MNLLAKLFFFTLASATPLHAEVSPDYYKNLRIQCKKNTCCLGSVAKMEKASGVLPGPSRSCFESWKLETVRCKGAFTWCEEDPSVKKSVEFLPLTEEQYKTEKAKCNGNSCCLSSIETVFKGKHSLAFRGICPAGSSGPHALKCIGARSWCERN